MYGGEDEKFLQKVMIKAEIIVGAASRLWGMYNQNVLSIRTGSPQWPPKLCRVLLAATW